jgi:hypothetical protein
MREGEAAEMLQGLLICGCRLRIVLAIPTAVMLAAGCAGTGIVKASGDTYIVSDGGSTLSFAPVQDQATSQAARMLKRAQEFCEQHNETAEPVKLEGRGRVNEAAHATLQFRCVAQTQ